MSDESKAPSNQGNSSESVQSSPRHLIVEKRGNLSTQPSGIELPPTAQFTSTTPQASGTPAASGGDPGASSAQPSSSAPKPASSSSES